MKLPKLFLKIKSEMKIAILADTSQKMHSSSWTYPWIEYCKRNSLHHEVINPYQIHVIRKLLEFDIILWHFSNYQFVDMLMARNILNTLETHGKKVFPSFKDAWHFDDKLSETYLLESIQAPIPQSFYFYSLKSVEQALQDIKIRFPIVAKLRNGSGSHNVKMLQSENDLIGYAKKMFGVGLNSSPSLLYKTTSNVRSAKDFNTFLRRAKRIPEFLRSLSNAKKFNRERGYVYLQEFIPNDGFDIKVIVVKDKLSFFCRDIRKGDFRASGGGAIFYDRTLITPDLTKSAFRVADVLGLQCVGYDYVIDSSNHGNYIIEMSYGFAHALVTGAGGYFDRSGLWHDEPLDVPAEIIKNLML